MSSIAVRSDIIAALRQGTVPERGLALFATGLEPLTKQVVDELEQVSRGRGGSKWLRGDYGAGKTFTARHLCSIARERGFATSEIQISVNDTPLHHLETVYRRLTERLQTPTAPPSAFQAIVDAWLYDIGDKVTRLTGLPETDPGYDQACERQIEDELADLSKVNPAFSAVLRAYHRHQAEGDLGTGQALLAWLAGQPHTNPAVLARAGVRGAVDGQAALTFLGGLVRLIRQSGFQGLVVVLDEVETIQRMPANVREKSLNALRQLMDLLGENRLPGLYLMVTGTPAFFDGPKGIRELPPLRDRLQTKFDADDRFDNLMAPQVRLRSFDAERLQAVGRAVRDLYPSGPEVTGRVDDGFIADLVGKLTQGFGGQVAVVPRLFLRTLVDVLDRAALHSDYDPRIHHDLVIVDDDLSPAELAARSGTSDAPGTRSHRLDG
jgi:hypothetical protein